MGHNSYATSARLSRSEERKPTLTGSNMQLHQTPTTVVEFQQPSEERLCFSLKIFFLYIYPFQVLGGRCWSSLAKDYKSCKIPRHVLVYAFTNLTVYSKISQLFFFFDCIEHIHKHKSTAVLFLKIKPLYHFFLSPPPLFLTFHVRFT